MPCKHECIGTYVNYFHDGSTPQYGWICECGQEFVPKLKEPTREKCSSCDDFGCNRDSKSCGCKCHKEPEGKTNQKWDESLKELRERQKKWTPVNVCEPPEPEQKGEPRRCETCIGKICPCTDCALRGIKRTAVPPNPRQEQSRLEKLAADEDKRYTERMAKEQLEWCMSYYPKPPDEFYSKAEIDERFDFAEEETMRNINLDRKNEREFRRELLDFLMHLTDNRGRGLVDQKELGELRSKFL